MFFPKSRFATIALTLLATALAAPAAHAGAIRCVNSNFDGFKAATIDDVATSSSTFSSIAGLSLGVINTGSCVQIQVSADVRTPSTGTMQIRIMIDDGTVTPGVITWTTPNGKTDHRTAVFLINGVSVGDHKVRIQFRSVTGAPVTLTRPLAVAIFKTV